MYLERMYVLKFWVYVLRVLVRLRLLVVFKLFVILIIVNLFFL